MQPNRPPQMTVQVEALQLVFVGPYLAPKGSYQIVPSPLEPGKIRLRFLATAIPEEFRAIIAVGAVRAFLPLPNGLPAEFVVLGAEVFEAEEGPVGNVSHADPVGPS